MSAHGTAYRYRMGCRCDACRARNSASDAAYYERNRLAVGQRRGYAFAAPRRVEVEQARARGHDAASVALLLGLDVDAVRATFARMDEIAVAS